jgi:hypothetical protein
MSDDAATEWLAVAASEVLNMEPSLFFDACAEARKSCTHHGQIIPAVLNHRSPVCQATRFRKDWEHSLAAFREGYPALSTSAAPLQIGAVLKQIERD